MHYQQESQDPFSPEKLQIFVAGLSGLAVAEVRKAKVLYLLNAVSDYHAAAAAAQALGSVQRSFGLFSLLRPLWGAQKATIDAAQQARKERILNAIRVWRDDIKGERFVIDGEEIVA